MQKDSDIDSVPEFDRHAKAHVPANPRDLRVYRAEHLPDDLLNALAGAEPPSEANEFNGEFLDTNLIADT